MPYIKQEERKNLDQHLAFAWQDLSAGQMNYMITGLVKRWIGDPSYTKIATMTGVLENVKQEMYRRLASPYEDAKIAENGDV